MHRTFQRGDVIEAKDYTITALHPYSEFYTRNGNEYDEENNSSLVLSIRGRRNVFLFTGDTGEEAEQDIGHVGKWLSAEVVKIPHHGSKTSAGLELLSEVAPSVAVISVGREILLVTPVMKSWKDSAGSRFLRTDRDGAIKMTETMNGLDIKTYNDFILEKAEGPAAEWRNVRRLFSR